MHCNSSRSSVQSSVSGIVSLTPATANSHVAILARSYGIPFIYLVDETERARVMQFTNREVVVQATTPPFHSECQAAVPISSFPDPAHSHTNLPRWDAWTMPTRVGTAGLRLIQNINEPSVDTRAPFKSSLDFAEFALILEARYAHSVPVIDSDFERDR